MIRKLVEKGDTKKALESLYTLLFDYVNEFRDEYTLLNGRHERYVLDKAKGLNSNSDNDLSMNKLNNDLLGFRNRMEIELKEFINIENLVISAESFEEQLRRKLVGRYRIEEELGVGRTSIIYRATEISTGKAVAVRALKTHDFGQTYTLESKKGDNVSSQRVREIRHRNIVKIQETYLKEFPVCFIESFVDGPSLKKLRKLGAWPVAETIRIITQVGDALYYLHTKGIVHKKIQAKKVFIDSEGIPIITTPAIPPFDMFTTSDGKNSLKRFRKNLQILSPEELLGKNADNKSDQFELALLAYELLTSKPLFEGESIQEVYELRNKFFKSKNHRNLVFKNSGIPIPLAKTLKRMLSLKPEDRYDSIKDAVIALAPFANEKTKSYQVARQSYERCCSGNPRFTYEFYERFFKKYPEILSAFFPHESNREQTRARNNMLRSAISLLLADPAEKDHLAMIKNMPQHAKIEAQHYRQFINVLIASIKMNDYLWNHDSGISEAWQTVKDQVIARFELK